MEVSFKSHLKLNRQEEQRLLKEWRQITAEAVQEAVDEAEERMTTYLIASVYGTVEGNKYERTELALSSLNARLMKKGTDTYLIVLSNDAPYAEAIELGTKYPYQDQIKGMGDVPQISAEELGMLLDSVAEDQGGEPHPEAFWQRSGQNYQVPGPHVTPAAVAAQYEFMRRLQAKLGRL